MISVPYSLVLQYQSQLKSHDITAITEYTQWLRYNLDFCEKYAVTGEDSECVCLFMDKLKEKNQPYESDVRLLILFHCESARPLTLGKMTD